MDGKEKMIKAVVFDMDGVIFDTEKLYRKHWIISGEEYGIPREEMEEVCNLIAGAPKERNSLLMKSRYGEDFDYWEFRTKTMNRMDEEIARDGIELKPGVFELLDYLKENGYKIGLATSTVEERAKRNLEYGKVYDYFDEIVYGGVVENGKPAPDIFLKACEQLGVKPSEAIGVEDSLNGVTSSSTAGLFTIMVIDLIKPTEKAREEADKIYDSLFEIIDFLKTEQG